MHLMRDVFLIKMLPVKCIDVPHLKIMTIRKKEINKKNFSFLFKLKQKNRKLSICTLHLYFCCHCHLEFLQFSLFHSITSIRKKRNQKNGEKLIEYDYSELLKTKITNHMNIGLVYIDMAFTPFMTPRCYQFLLQHISSVH